MKTLYAVGATMSKDHLLWTHAAVRVSDQSSEEVEGRERRHLIEEGFEVLRVVVEAAPHALVEEVAEATRAFFGNKE